MTDNAQDQSESSKITIPEELSGKTIDSSHSENAATSNDNAVVKAEEKFGPENGDLIEYAKHVHGYIREYISTADKKATFIFTIGAALLVYLYEKNIVLSYLSSKGNFGFSELFAFIAISFLAVACVLSVIVVFPKLSGSKRGLLFWEGITQFSTPMEYSMEVQRLKKLGLINETLMHCHELAKICKEKFRLVNWALRIGSVGAISMILFLVFKQMPK